MNFNLSRCALGWIVVVALVGFWAGGDAAQAVAAPPSPVVQLSASGLNVAVTSVPTGYLVAWQETAGADSFIAAQFLDRGGALRGSSFAVDAAAPNGQAAPVVAADSGGGFVVAWLGNPFGPILGDVWYRLFDPAGRPRAESRRATVRSQASQPVVAMEPGGGFAIAWNEAGAYWLRRFTRRGQPTRLPCRFTSKREEAFLLSLAFPGGPSPGLTTAVWSECRRPSCYRSSSAQRRIRPGGVPAGPVDTLDPLMGLPRAFTGPEGELVVAGVGPGHAAVVQRFRDDGVPLTLPREISSTSCGPDPAPEGSFERMAPVAFRSPRWLAVVHQVSLSDGDGFLGSELFLRVLDIETGEETLPCRRLTGGLGVVQLQPAATFGPDGRLLVSWGETSDLVSVTPERVEAQVHSIR